MNEKILETLCFRITTRCNLHCNFCRAGSSPDVRDKINVKALQKFIKNAQKVLGLRHISISGGEPGLDRRLVPLIDWLVARGIFVTVTTNGTSKISRLLGHGVESYVGRVRVRVSLDGDMKLHDYLRGDGTYAVAVREAQLLKEKFGWLGVNTLVGAELSRRKLGTVAIFGNLDVDEWALITPVPEGSAKGKPWIAEDVVPRAIKLRRQAESDRFKGRVVIWNFLGTPNTSVLINVDGSIVLAGVRGDDDILIGSLSIYSVDVIKFAINRAIRENKQTYFKWKGWNYS